VFAESMLRITAAKVLPRLQVHFLYYIQIHHCDLKG
jgi:hypothetical protein